MFKMPKIFANLPGEQPRADDLWTVFLVDDDPDDQHLAMQILKKSPFIGEIVCVSRGDDLFNALAARKYLLSIDQRQQVLVLLDIHMPGITGLALLEQLRSNPYTSSFPVIILTGDQKSEKIYESYRRSASSFINKPFTQEHLANIHTILEYGDSQQRSSRVF